MTLLSNETILPSNQTIIPTLSNDTINDPETNDANWLGLNKLAKGDPLMNILHGYMLYIFVVTMYNFILLKQQRQR